jgi:hypothetical protein
MAAFVGEDVSDRAVDFAAVLALRQRVQRPALVDRVHRPDLYESCGLDVIGRDPAPPMVAACVFRGLGRQAQVVTLIPVM